MLVKTGESALWRVLYTKPRAEKRACEALEEKGCQLYLPVVKTLKQWSDRKKKIEEPLFKSYLFIYGTLAQTLEAAQHPHIVTVVRFGTQPAVVRPDEIAAIRLAVADEKAVTVVAGKLQVGQQVRVVQGALRNREGILTEFRGTKRIAIEIESLGCSLLIELPSGSVEEVK